MLVIVALFRYSLNGILDSLYVKHCRGFVDCHVIWKRDKKYLCLNLHTSETTSKNVIMCDKYARNCCNSDRYRIIVF